MSDLSPQVLKSRLPSCMFNLCLFTASLGLREDNSPNYLGVCSHDLSEVSILVFQDLR